MPIPVNTAVGGIADHGWPLTGMGIDYLYLIEIRKRDKRFLLDQGQGQDQGQEAEMLILGCRLLASILNALA